METYRRGHNGPDSKSGIQQCIVGSNPTVSAKQKTDFFSRFFCLRLIWRARRVRRRRLVRQVSRGFPACGRRLYPSVSAKIKSRLLLVFYFFTICGGIKKVKANVPQIDDKKRMVSTNHSFFDISGGEKRYFPFTSFSKFSLNFAYKYSIQNYFISISLSDGSGLS